MRQPIGSLTLLAGTHIRPLMMLSDTNRDCQITYMLLKSVDLPHEIMGVEVADMNTG
jgi:hypothetical protein